MNDQYSTVKFFLSPEKEEAWLKQKALEGWRLTKVSGFPSYTFIKSAPEKMAYKIDYRSFKKQADRDDYLALFKDSGWDAVMPKEVNYAFYFISKQDSARKDIFSDEVSRAQRNLRYANITASSLIPAMMPILVLYFSNNFQPAKVGYLTPGLWQMSGAQFVSHFLFETPFVLMRLGIYLLPLVLIVLGLYFLLRYYLLYQKAVREQRV
jgi:hypothetical protein